MTGVAKATETKETRIGKAMNNTTSSTPAPGLLSALADGELGGLEFDAALLACRQDSGTALSSWNTYHLIGEVLRSPSAGVHGADAQFLGRFRQRLGQEQAGGLFVAPVEAAPENLSHSPQLQVPLRGRASNDESFRWKLVAGFASLAAVSAIAWNASGFLAPEAAPRIAQAGAPQQVLVASPQGPVVRDARLEELLAAHRQLGGMSALQAPSGFLQNATFDTTQGARR